jgi:D-alanyl-D-alanine carboxypeptidase/D-alanyl-D-alanine-endopeptidase (penicillin-binding protein 4)
MKNNINKIHLLKHRFIAGAFIFLIFFSFAQTPSTLHSALNNLINAKGFETAIVGVCIVSAEDNKEIISYNAHKKLIPASITKLITTYNALQELKPEFTFKTKVSIYGTINSGTLKGIIKITGSGDPTLQSKFFNSEYNSIVQAVINYFKQKEIRQFIGNIETDYSVFDFPGTPSTWLWSDIGNYYGAAPCGLNYKDNYITVYLQSSSENEPIKIVKTIPDNIPFTFINQLKAKHFKKDSAYGYCYPYSNKILLSGAIPIHKNNFKIKIANPQPYYFIKQDLELELNKNAIQFTESKTANKTNELLYEKEIYSPALTEIIKITNLYSNNLYAESINFYLGYYFYNKGNFLTGIKAQNKLLQKLQLPVNELTLFDGSGMSPMNAVSPYFFTQILYQAQSSTFNKQFYASLPISGISGTLSNFGKNTVLENNLRAKSGYMEGVRTYAGYFTAKSRKKYIFCIMVNHYSCSAYQAKKQIEAFLVNLYADL